MLNLLHYSNAMDENANRYPPEMVSLVAERMYQVLQDINSTGRLNVDQATPDTLRDCNTQLRDASALVNDTESKLTAHRETRAEDADKTYAAMVNQLNLCQVVFGIRSIEYKRVRAEFDELTRKRRRPSAGQNGNDAPGSK